MAFKGDLTNISLFDVFQTLNQNKQNGVLVLAHEGTTRKIHISPEGVRIFFSRGKVRLGEIFVRRGRITTQDVEILLMEQKKAYRPFGELLADSGKVTQEEVDTILRCKAEDEIFEIFGWESGTFSFYDGQEAGDTKSPLSGVIMDPAGLCLEAARRLDEMERLRSQIPSDDEYFIDAGGEEPDPEQTPAHVLAAFTHLREPNSVDNLRDLEGLTLFDALTTLNYLIEGGFVRRLGQDELINNAQAAQDSGDYTRAATLFEEARKLSPDDRTILELCVEVAERLDDSRRLAKYLAMFGRVLLDQGEVDAAIENLELALRQPGTHLEAMLSLRDAYGEARDLERVAEISLKIGRVHAEQRRLDDALESCVVGLEAVPGAISLRFYYAQLLVRCGETEAAQEQIWSLIQYAEQRPVIDGKVHDLLASCYRLLLKIDHTDKDADAGLRDLDRKRMSTLRRRKLVVRSGIAAALLLVFAGIGFSVGGGSASAKWSGVLKAQESRPNHAYVLELIDELVEKHPDSDEAEQALTLKQEIVAVAAAVHEKKQSERAAIKGELTQDLENVRTALSDLDYVNALEPTRELLAKLEQSRVSFLRKDMGVQVEYELGVFLVRVTKQFDQDRKQVTAGEVQLKQLKSKPEELKNLENRLARVRQRDWIRVLPELIANLRTLCDSPLVNDAEEAFHEFKQKVQASQATFDNLDALFFTVRSERLQAEIVALVDNAKTKGKDHLRVCQFTEARAAYEAAHQKSDRVVFEEPRKYFLGLLNWLDLRNIPAEMQHQIRKIDHVVATLNDVENLRKEGSSDAAYRLMRDLVSEHRLIQFEERYKMPFRVVSMPAGASVTVDGIAAGTTPCDISLDIGLRAADVRLHKTGFDDSSARLVPTDPKLTGTLRVELAKELAWDKEMHGGGIEAPPTIADGKVLLATTDASLLAINVKDGSRAWEARTKLLHRVTARPVVAGKHAYLITVDGHLHAVRLTDGKIVGKRELGAQVDREPAVHDGVVYVVTRKPSLIALRGTDVIYEVPLGQSPSTRVIYLKGKLYVGTTKGSVLVHDAKNGKETGRFTVSSGTSFWGGLTAHRDIITAGAEDGKLYAFDTNTGKKAWEFATGGPLAAPPATDGSYLYLGARDGYLNILNTDGRRTGFHDVGSALNTEPTLLGDFVYILGSNRALAFDLNEQQPWWDRAFQDEFPQHIVSGEGFVVIVTDKPWIYAFSKDSK